MIMAENEVKAFLEKIEPASKRKDCFAIMKMMEKAAEAPAKLWPGKLIGFGTYHYKYDSGREGDWFLTGFAPRKNNISLYIISGVDKYPWLLQDLGSYKTGKSCLYIKNLDEVNTATLQKLIEHSVKDIQSKYSKNEEN